MYIYFIDKIISVQYIDQFYVSVLLHDEESDALHKRSDYVYKDTEYKYFGCLNMSSELFTVCFWADCEGNLSTFGP